MFCQDLTTMMLSSGPAVQQVALPFQEEESSLELYELLYSLALLVFAQKGVRIGRKTDEVRREFFRSQRVVKDRGVGDRFQDCQFHIG